MLNNNKKTKSIINSYINNSGIDLTPAILKSIGKNIDIKKENNILKQIDKKEIEIFRLFYDKLGKYFLNQKPKSVVLFEKRLKRYFFSPKSKFLNNFPSIKNKLNNEINKSDNINLNNKINIGSMIYYSLNNKKNSNDVYVTNNKEKYLETSNNFSYIPIKDVVNTEFYKKKYLENNAKRINRILKKKSIKYRNKNKDIFISKNNTNYGKKFNSNEISKKNFNIKTKINDIFFSKDKNKEISKNNNDTKENFSYCFIKCPSSDNNDKKNEFNNENNVKRYDSINTLTERKISDYIYKNENKYNNSLSAKIINSPEITIQNNHYHNNIYFDYPSTLNTIINKNTFSEFQKKIKRNRKNSNIKLLKNTNSIIITKNKNKSRNAINLEDIKKASTIYKMSIDNNINKLDKYTRSCNSLLVKLVRKNKSKVKTNINEDKELKALISNKLKKKNKSNYLKNKIKEEKKKKLKILINDTFLNYDINKLLKEKTNYGKIDNNNIINKYYLLKENNFFGNCQNNFKIYSPEIHGLMSYREKKIYIKNTKMKKLRKKVKVNNYIIERLKNFIKVDKGKIINNFDEIYKNNNKDKSF